MPGSGPAAGAEYITRGRAVTPPAPAL